MNASAQLVTNMAELTTAVTTELAAIQAYIAAAPNQDDPNVVAANAQLTTLIANLNAETVTLSPTTPTTAASGTSSVTASSTASGS